GDNLVVEQQARPTVRTLSPDIAAGSIIYITGTGLGLDTGSYLPHGDGVHDPWLVPQSRLSTLLGKTSVTMNGVELPLFSASPVEIVAQAPFELEGVERATLQVNVADVLSEPVEVPLKPAAPALFIYYCDDCAFDTTTVETDGLAR